MKLNIAFPKNGTVKQFEITEETLRRVHLSDYRLGQDIDGALLGDNFKGYVFRLKGGSDKSGFPMIHGVIASARVSLLVPRGAVGFNTFRGRHGERRRKSLRGCILGNDLAVINVTIVRRGEGEIEGVTDTTVARRLGPKRASHIRRLFALERNIDPTKFVVRRLVKAKLDGKKDRFKSPKIQRLITDTIRKRRQLKVVTKMAQVRKSAAARKEFLMRVAKKRMATRQHKHSRGGRQRSVQDKLEQAAFSTMRSTTVPIAAATKKVKAPAVKATKK